MHRYPWKLALVMTAFGYLSLPFCVCATVVHVEACCSYSPSHMVSPHFITLLPLWAAVPTALGGVGVFWNFRSHRVWSGGLISSLSQLPLTPPNSSLGVFASNLRSVLVQTQRSLYCANIVTVVTDPSRDTTPARLATEASQDRLPRQ